MMPQTIRTKNWWFLLARLALGSVFLYASADKILHPADFAAAVYNYQILPHGLINLTALFLPWLELFLGVALIAGVWLPGAVLWGNALLWTFFIALLFNQFRGIDVHCGCFSTRPDPSSPPPMAWYLIRDPVFLFIAGYLGFQLFLASGPPRMVHSPTVREGEISSGRETYQRNEARHER